MPQGLIFVLNVFLTIYTVFWTFLSARMLTIYWVEGQMNHLMWSSDGEIL